MQYNSLAAAGWRYDPAANGSGGWVRGDTRWNATTNQFDTNGVGGTVFAGGSGVSAATSPWAGQAQAQMPAAPVAQAGVSQAPWAGSARTSVRVPTVQAQMIGNGVIPSAAGVSRVGWNAVDPFTIEDDAILQELNAQALKDLQLGGALSAQEERGAQQSARAAYAARGMAYSNPAVAAEVVKRDEYANARLAARRAFALQVAGANQPLDLANAAAQNQAALANSQGQLAADEGNSQRALGIFNTVTGARVNIATANQGAGLSAATANQQAALNQQSMADAWGLGQAQLQSNWGLAGLSAAVTQRGQNMGQASSNYGTQAGMWEAQLRALLQQMQGGDGGNQADLIAGAQRQAGQRAAAPRSGSSYRSLMPAAMPRVAAGGNNVWY